MSAKRKKKAKREYVVFLFGGEKYLGFIDHRIRPTRRGYETVYDGYIVREVLIDRITRIGKL